MRAIQQLKQVTHALKMTAFDGMLLPMRFKQITSEGILSQQLTMISAAKTMFHELQHLGHALKRLRPETLLMA